MWTFLNLVNEVVNELVIPAHCRKLTSWPCEDKVDKVYHLFLQVLTQLPTKRRQRVVFDISESSNKDKKVGEFTVTFIIECEE